jgi:NADH-quinone oxidoreductase subunit N
MFSWNINWIELLPVDILSYFNGFSEAFDAAALQRLTAESFLLVCVSIFWVTLGLVKTTKATGAEIALVNSLAKLTSLFILLIALGLTLTRAVGLNGAFYLLNDMIVLDMWVAWAQVGLLVLAITFVMMSSAYSYTRNSYYYELMAFTLTATMLMTWLVMSWNFIIFYLVLEGISLIFYTIATRNFVYGGVESGLKYYSLGALASVMLLVGILCVFAATGSTDFLVIGLFVKHAIVGSTGGLLLIVGLTLLALAVFFKLSAFPGHVWTPDVYEGTSMEVLWIFAVLAKFTFSIVFLRFFALFFVTPLMFTATNFWVASSCLGSLILGAAGAFLATNMKRFVAYTAINQMGFLFIGLAALSVDGVKSTITYLYIYMLANVLFFCVMTLLQAKKYVLGDVSLRSLNDVVLIKKAPIEMSLLAVSLLSLGGLPPLAGFAGKYLLWSSLISQYLQTGSFGIAENLLYILIVSVVLSLLSTFYYLRLIKMALFDAFMGGVRGSVLNISGVGNNLIVTVILVVLGLVIVGWFFMLTDLDSIWTHLTLAVMAPLGLAI